MLQQQQQLRTHGNRRCKLTSARRVDRHDDLRVTVRRVSKASGRGRASRVPATLLGAKLRLQAVLQGWQGFDMTARYRVAS